MSAGELLVEVQDLLGKVEQERTYVSDEPSALSMAAFRARKVAPLLDQAARLLHAIDAYYGSGRPDKGPTQSGNTADSLTDIGALISVEVAAQEIADIAFLALNHAKEGLEGLRRATARDDVAQIASLSEAGLRRLRRGLIALEYSICQFEGWDPPERERIDLAAALKVRRLFWELRRIILSDGVPAASELARRLRNIVAVFEAVRTRDVYSLVRIDDRIEMRRLIRRIDSHLSGKEGHDPDAGRHLWGDIIAFAELLRGVNNRQEIREHDIAVVEYGWRLLAENGGTETRLRDRLGRLLETLLGLDPELDQLVLEPTKHKPEAWRSCLEHLRASLFPHDASVEPDG